MHYVTKIFNKQTYHLFQSAYLREEKNPMMFKILLPHVNLHQLIEKTGLEQTSVGCSLMIISAIYLESMYLL